MSKKTMAQLIREDRRLAILRLINESNGKQTNSSILHSALLHLRIVCEQHELIDDLRFMELHGLVQLDQSDVNDTLYVIHLLGRGEDFLGGLIQIDGIKPTRRG